MFFLPNIFLQDREEGKVRSWNLKTCTGIIHSYKLGTYLPTNDKILLVHPELEIIFGALLKCSLFHFFSIIQYYFSFSNTQKKEKRHYKNDIFRFISLDTP